LAGTRENVVVLAAVAGWSACVIVAVHPAIPVTAPLHRVGRRGDAAGGIDRQAGTDTVLERRQGSRRQPGQHPGDGRGNQRDRPALVEIGEPALDGDPPCLDRRQPGRGPERPHRLQPRGGGSRRHHTAGGGIGNAGWRPAAPGL
jgi:hypothetical protein